MAEGQDGAEKTEEPTQKKRDDARKDGKIATSTEVYVAATLAVATLILILGRGLLENLTLRWRNTLIFDDPLTLDTCMHEALTQLLIWTVAAGVGLGLPMVATVLIAQTGVGGLNFAPKAMGFKGEKINPAAGLKRMVSTTALVNLGKSILKVVLLLSSATVMVWPFLPSIQGAAMLAPGDTVVLFGAVLVRVLLGLLVGLALIAGLDVVWQRHSQAKSLRMSIQDIKDEMKESEGSPEQKGLIRRRQIEASQRAAECKALQDVPTATAVVTNPTDFAVALKYDPQSGQAPVIVAMGKGPMAAEIRKIAKRARISTLPLPPLARALYFNGAIGREIPEALFAAVAIVLAHVWHLENGQYAPPPDVDLPPQMRIDA
ncbi:MAG: EscU/YscU/HrcU family type III secretion system export apparatus switch protein, partial [Loktanella sp.]|nr:EscU/YscU/HrcU family type III secretion system export apparatus switch protein [Loktanella sp.]